MAIYLRDRFQCLYCERKFTARCFNLTLDHVVAYVNGGSNAPSNLITACRSCNSARQDSPLADFADKDTRRAIYNARRRKINRKAARRLINGEA